MSSTNPYREESSSPVALRRKSSQKTLLWVLAGGGAVLMACVCVAFAGITSFLLFFPASRSAARIAPVSQPAGPAITAPANSTVVPAAPIAPVNPPEPEAQVDQPQVGLEVGNLAPDFKLAGIDGKTYHLSDFRGQPVLLNFWATWCGPCQEEMPAISKKYQQYKDQNLIVLAVDVNEGPDLARAYARRYNLPFLFLDDHDGQVSITYRIRGLPTSVFIDPAGIVQMRVLGSMTDNRIQLGIDSITP
ncbi:MAG: TlpA family protein disulfide reductase [Chloroflexi bacterium]|nr:TlpA family protein disulfide reductase [Chloroflexota bacterium]